MYLAPFWEVNQWSSVGMEWMVLQMFPLMLYWTLLCLASAYLYNSRLDQCDKWVICVHSCHGIDGFSRKQIVWMCQELIRRKVLICHVVPSESSSSPMGTSKIEMPSWASWMRQNHFWSLVVQTLDGSHPGRVWPFVRGSLQLSQALKLLIAWFY
jgi:hypothetical protein